MVEKIRTMADGLRDKQVGVLGLSFKPNTSDIRESPAIRIIQEIQKEGARIRAFDPVAIHEARRVLQDVEYGTDEYDTANGCDALVLATEWNQFRNLDLPRIKKLMRQPVMIDLRNVYEPEDLRRQGFRYTAVGR
jgi:UDPglucose 6-dehydrogenase